MFNQSISFQTPNLEDKNLNKSVACVLFFKEKLHRMKTSDKAPMCTPVFCCSLPIHTYMHAGRRRYAGAAIKSPPHRGGECVSHHPVLYGNPSRWHSATFSANYHKYRVIFPKLSEIQGVPSDFDSKLGYYRF